MKIRLNQLLKDKKYRKMSLKRLDNVINLNLNFSDYEKLKGKYSDGKAKYLIKKWNKPQKSTTTSKKKSKPN